MGAFGCIMGVAGCKLRLGGCKGWLFADTPQGAEASAIIYSLMETAKANSLRLDDYLLHLLSILPERAEQSKTLRLMICSPGQKK